MFFTKMKTFNKKLLQAIKKTQDTQISQEIYINMNNETMYCVKYISRKPMPYLEIANWFLYV